MSRSRDWRRTVNRCNDLHVEYAKTNGRRSSWRCDLVKGHTGDHESSTGHRTWTTAPPPPSLFGADTTPTRNQALTYRFNLLLRDLAELPIEDVDDVEALRDGRDTLVDLAARVNDKLKTMRVDATGPY